MEHQLPNPWIPDAHKTRGYECAELYLHTPFTPLWHATYTEVELSSYLEELNWAPKFFTISTLELNAQEMNPKTLFWS